MQEKLPPSVLKTSLLTRPVGLSVMYNTIPYSISAHFPNGVKASGDI